MGVFRFLPLLLVPFVDPLVAFIILPWPEDEEGHFGFGIENIENLVNCTKVFRNFLTVDGKDLITAVQSYIKFNKDRKGEIQKGRMSKKNIDCSNAKR